MFSRQAWTPYVRRISRQRPPALQVILFNRELRAPEPQREQPKRLRMGNPFCHPNLA
jgi:hypothetical protein